MRVLKSVCCAAALLVLLAPGARADDWNKKTFLTFSGPVQVPGATLPAGTYTFKLADLSGNRHVVQIFDKEEKKIYTTLLAIPDQKLEPSDKPVVLFAERPAGSPVAVKAWFYPGETIGNEFVYPKSQALAIAKATHESVLSTNAQANANASDAERMNAWKGAEVSRVDERGQMAPTTTASDDAQLKNSSRNAGVATSGQTANNTATGRRRLPRTGSNLVLLELISVLSIAGGFGLRRRRDAR